MRADSPFLSLPLVNPGGCPVWPGLRCWPLAFALLGRGGAPGHGECPGAAVMAALVRAVGRAVCR